MLILKQLDFRVEVSFPRYFTVEKISSKMQFQLADRSHTQSIHKISFVLMTRLFILPLCDCVIHNPLGFQRLHIFPAVGRGRQDSSRQLSQSVSPLWPPYANHHIHHMVHSHGCALCSLLFLLPTAILVCYRLKFV